MAGSRRAAGHYAVGGAFSFAYVDGEVLLIQKTGQGLTDGILVGRR